jgi:hypothetical protein
VESVPVRLAILLCFTSALWGCSRNSRQEVARVLGEPVFADEVTPDERELAAIVEPRMTPAQRLREERRARITTRIIRPLESRYVRQRNLHPMDEEIEQFIQSHHEHTAQVEQKLRADLHEQRRRLAAAESAAEREEASARVEALEALLALREGEVRRRELLDDEERSELEEYQALSDRELASVWVATWKFHRSLHREFGGGAVAWRDSGPEPIGAYRKWLEGLESSGDFTITAPELRELFWSYWRADPDVIVNPDEDPFAAPWWVDQTPTSRPAAYPAGNSAAAPRSPSAAHVHDMFLEAGGEVDHVTEDDL